MSEQFRIGRNAVENTELVLQSGDKDVWFHISGSPSAHLVYFNPYMETLDDLRKSGIIYKMALELKKKSKYRKEQGIMIIYDYIKNITVTTKPGLVTVTSSVKNLMA